ncbi:hypothetical protein PoB_005337500 [Plakobranchus ocellatus]|uniref:DUF7041 domain-containing protein n=1 Tax=Plakobranchus ocellatus TaxID=259542 RepID=A0AAV4C5D1_9GAST|nr:hypothetical protein PoB_005337500 [Plakobranchus ocellatus]
MRWNVRGSRVRERREAGRGTGGGGGQKVEAQFDTKNITQEQTRYGYVVSALDIRTAEEVQEVLVNPPGADRYATLKNALIKAFGKSQAQRDCELLSLNGLGDKKPTALLRKVNALNDDP